MRTRRAVATALALLLGGSTSLAREREPEVPEALQQVCVQVRTVRLHRGVPVASRITGIAVHPEGFVVSDLAAVEHRLPSTRPDGGGVEEARVLELGVLLPDGRGRSRQVHARVVQVDRSARLVLLAAGTPLEAVLEDDLGGSGSGSGSVSLLGFSVRGYQPAASAGTRADLTMRTGTVSREPAGTGSPLVATDILSESGHCGGLVVSEDGSVVGLGICATDATPHPVFVAPIARVREFVLSSLLEVAAEPAVVLAPPEPIVFSIRPTAELPTTAGWQGRVRILDAHRELVGLELDRGTEGWSAVMAAMDDLDPSITRLVAELTLHDERGRLRFQRQLPLDVVPRNPAPPVQPPVEPAMAAAATPTPGTDRPTTRDTAALAALARDLELTGTKAGDGSRVIDNSLVAGLGIEPEPFTIEERRYLPLGAKVGAVEVAQRYDEALYNIAELQRILERLEAEYRDDPDQFGRAYHQRRRELQEKLYFQYRRALEAQRDVSTLLLASCPDGTWHFRPEAPCVEPFIPEVPEVRRY